MKALSELGKATSEVEIVSTELLREHEPAHSSSSQLVRAGLSVRRRLAPKQSFPDPS